MTDDKKKSELEKLRKERYVGGVAILLVMFGGLAVMFVGVIGIQPFADLNDHMTDPTIPHNELENATYTWTAQEIEKKADDALVWFMVGGGVTIAGLVGTIAIPSQKRLHKIHCTGNTEWKYCPECGLKLSLLRGES